MLSASSTVLKALDSDAPSSFRHQNNEQRKRRHRDGKLLREGVGLTTGLGWSDSEDENAPGPLRRKISDMILKRTMNTAASFTDTSLGEPSQSSSQLARSVSSIPLGVKPSYSGDFWHHDDNGDTITSRSNLNSKPIPSPITPEMTPDSSTNSLKSTLSSLNELPIPGLSSNRPLRQRSSPPVPILSPTIAGKSLVRNYGEDELEAAEAAYRASKELTSTISRRSSRVASTVGSRDSMWSNGTGVLC